MQRWIQTIMTASWSQVKAATYHEHAQEAIVSLRGSRPGDPVADLAFTTLMYQVLERTIQDVPHILGTPLEPGSDKVSPPVAWVDDVALFITDPSPAVLTQKVQQAVAAFTSRCAQKGLEVNFRQGKSEVLLRLEGRGSQAESKRIRALPKEALPIPGTNEAISTSTSYVHLGQKQCASMNHDVAAADRLKHAVQALQDIRPLLRHKYLSITAKATFASAFVFSKLLYGAELWTGLTPGMVTRLHAFIVKVFRVILDCRNFRETSHVTDQQVQAKFPIDTFAVMNHVAKLRHFGKLVADAPQVLLDTLCYQHAQGTTGWLTELYAATEWAAGFCPHLQQLPASRLHLAPWISMVQADAKRWKNLCTRLRKRANLYAHIQARRHEWEQEFDQILYAAPLSQLPVEPTVGAFACPTCAQTFHSAKGLAVHRLTLHNEPAFARRFMPDGTTCGACLKSYQNSQKLRQHLQWRANGCLNRLEEVWLPMTNEEVADVPLESGRVTSHRQPPQITFGPPLPTRAEWEAAAPHKVFPVATSQAQIHAFQQAVNAWLEDSLRQQAAVPEVPRNGALPARDRHRILLNAQAAVQDFRDDRAPPALRAQLSAALQHAIGRSDDPAPEPVPQAGLRPIKYQPPVLPLHNGKPFVLYFYAGHRREGDLHQCMRELSQAYGMEIELVPLDIVYHARLCDLLDEHAKQFWMAVVASGSCLGLLGAPPCETWSIARWRALLVHDAGPRPVRDVDQPWGLATASYRELHQLLVANSLLQTWLLFAALAATLGISWAMEHPAHAPRLPRAASVWLLPQMAELCRAGAKTRTILQGLYGAVSAKPTTFATFAMPAFSECLQRWQQKGVRRQDWVTLCGKDAQGHFRTMAAKAYPRLLNFVLGETYVQRFIQLQAVAPVKDVTTHPGLTQALEEIQAARQCSGTKMGLDFARRAF
eukprot:Skav222103  [mRNA]  locus=scaffold4111:20221:23028:- [translate_table: standard]